MVFRSLSAISTVFVLAVGASSASIFACAGETQVSSTGLPVFFFHGITGNHHNGDNLVANLTAEGRVVVPLTFCEDECSIESIESQVPMAIAQIREIVADNSTFDDGYIFIAHSQGGQISRSVIETMDDHKVRKYISLAGIQNGVFFGPQDIAVTESISSFNAVVFPNTTGFDYTAYSGDELRGQMQHDLIEFLLLNPQWAYTYAQPNHIRSPVFESWAASNPHLPLVNNVNPCATNDTVCTDAKAQRKANFLKLEEAHFFGSADDGLVTPWQLEILGQTSEVDTLDEIITKFDNFTILDMTETREYLNDTYGLRTLDGRGGLFIHQVPGVPHVCWIMDTTGTDGNLCSFDSVYDQHVYSLLK